MTGSIDKRTDYSDQEPFHMSQSTLSLSVTRMGDRTSWQLKKKNCIFLC